MLVTTSQAGPLPTTSSISRYFRTCCSSCSSLLRAPHTSLCPNTQACLWHLTLQYRAPQRPPHAYVTTSKLQAPARFKQHGLRQLHAYDAREGGNTSSSSQA
mmetsp:Transcript_20061/g.43710  ORF Transcript_20061/g.43710 Transcript_20061/m.43710 type:complete len:102 (-) Transcript_20061:148-453(-)